ncbi:hypothetical protein ACJMK2_018918 [Sinanodonta woodiana]|uniref:C2H2-type domain-containing protein n=1 Tax=Sinanodonta woodiana TaxID=1069815 RepID=A0ABD3UI95_SINWO
MRIQKETIEKIVPNSREYKFAVKSVIQWQIQGLLQKLALETGDESIIISTNVRKGTYNHYGSIMGKEFLEKDDPLLPSICTNFFKFCTGLQKDICNPFLSHNAEDQTEEATSNEDSIDREKNHNTLIGQPRIASSNNIDFSIHQQQQLIQDALARGISGQNLNPVLTNQQKSGVPNEAESIADTTTTMGVALFNEIESDDIEVKAEKESVNESFAKGDNSSIPPVWIKIEPNDDIEINEHSGYNIFPTGKVALSNMSTTSGSVSKSPYIPLANIQKRQMTPKTQYSEQSSDALLSSFAQGSSKPSSACIKMHNSSTNSDRVYMDIQNMDSDSNLQPNSHEIATLVSDQSKMYVVHKKQNMHVRFSSEDGRLLYMCQICGRDLSNHASLNRHMLTHNMVKPFRCLLCGKFYIRKYQVQEHIQKHHKGEDPKKYYSRLLPKIKRISSSKLIPSSQTDSSSLSTSRLNLSDQSVSMDEFSVEENQFEESKGTHFETRAEVDVQELSSDSDHSLSTLKKSLQSAASEHVLAATEEKPSNQFMLAPPRLKKQDMSSYHLNQSYSEHADDSVDVNQSSFFHQHTSGRVRHMPKKRGRKPQNKVLVLYCDICNKDFNHPSSYYRHLHLHDTKPPFKCEDCGKGFIRKYVYRAHMVSEHGVDLNDEKQTKE